MELEQTIIKRPLAQHLYSSNICKNNSRQINLYAKVIIIADMFFSLDTIEHGILRKTNL
jgi:hypothetical protein